MKCNSSIIFINKGFFFRNFKSEVYYFNLILEIYKHRFYWFKYSPSAIFTFSINFSPRQKYKQKPNKPKQSLLDRLDPLSGN